MDPFPLNNIPYPILTHERKNAEHILANLKATGKFSLGVLN